MHRITAPAESVLHKIRNLTVELELLQREICAELSLADAAPNQNLMRNEAGEDLAQFRTALDQLRRVLWFYFEEITTAKPAEKLIPQTIERASLEPSPSFFDRLNLVIEGYVQTRAGFELVRRKPPATESWKDDGRDWQSSIRSRTPIG